jgi:glucose/arabinose dehydrogenase
MVARALLTSLVILYCTPSLAVAQVRAELVASGFANPTALVYDPAIPGTAYVVEQGGLVRVISNGLVLPTPFIDLRGVVLSGGERGLLGMAFPPDAAQTGRVFFNFTNASGHTVIARFTRTTANPLAADPASRFDLRWPTGEAFIRQPFANHNGGHLAFGPDGNLYIGLGDGGSANDPQNNAQNPFSPLGKVLRLDVRVPDGHPTGYQVPPDNPFVGGRPILALAEIWAFGLRNPWRYSFDDFGADATGALIIADVGQNQREEINYEPRGAGGRNYGWRLREARIPTPGVPQTVPAYGPLTDPVYDYTHTDGQSVTGGYVYRGSRLGAAYRGRYFFADFVTSRVWSAGMSIDATAGEASVIDVIEHTAELGGSTALGGISSFARDFEGELYLTTFAGRVLRLGPNSGVPDPPRDLHVVVSGSIAVVRWNAPREGAVPSQYQLEAGSAAGASNLAVVSVNASLNLLSFAGLPPGTYFVRLRAIGQSGASAPSEEVVVVVSATGCTTSPPAPLGLAAIVNGRAVRLVWDEPATANGPVDLLIEAGSQPGVANLAIFAVDGTLRVITVAAPPGTYFVRLRARNACGTSAPSEEIVVTVY